IFLDAYPTRVPRLKAEIMNSHYPKYYDDGKQGPTEDQSPNPQKFWAVDTQMDGHPLNFVFRFLLHRDIASHSEYPILFEKGLRAALEKHGLGAKTAIGHGKFQIIPDEHEKIVRDVDGPTTKSAGSTTKRGTVNNLEKLLDRLSVMKKGDAGSIAAIIEKIDILETDLQKAELAKAIKDKLGSKVFKKSKKRSFLESLIGKNES
ncbi:MAG: type III-B CRISPR module RAMP protein Cmr6, partial [Deltaproteobacteria bacterium]|nr:type III-B CRISPR module RAMP protein Cmr6 [Deltaproteobacteria bacterium]